MAHRNCACGCRILPQGGKLLGQIFAFKQFLYVVVRLPPWTADRCPSGKIQYMDFLADFLDILRAWFSARARRCLSELEPAGHDEVFVPWIIRQRIAHGIDHMRKDIQPYHIGGTESRAFWAADQGAG